MNSAKKWILALLAVILLGCPAGVSASDTKQPGEWSPKPSERWLEVVKKERRLYLRQGDQILKAYRVAIGSGRGVKKSPIDKITPVGVFTIRRIADARNWVFDPKVFNEPGEPQKDVYGKWAISFKNPWNLAIHGTNAPWSIGKAVTHGCIRLRNEDIEELIKHVKPGMKLVIREKPLGGKDARKASQEKGNVLPAKAQGIPLPSAETKSEDAADTVPSSADVQAPESSGSGTAGTPQEGESTS